MNNKRKHASDEESDSDLDNSQNANDEEGSLRCGDIYVAPPPRPPGTIYTSGPRLIISQIVNTNFKSYGNEQILGPFHHNFNAIVGPNGSGKSNVIDSLLFVFGYRASKIRSKKLAVLLHKSEKYQHVQSCTVAIHFCKILDKDGDPGYEVIPNTEFVVSRTANKDNSSFYQHNGSRMQYKEIATLLRTHGVDLDHNRFLILQGEVEQISLMKPKAQTEHDTGMLEYLEDIIGTTRFKAPLAKVNEKIEHYSDYRMDIMNRVKLAEQEKNDLEEPMKEAVQFLVQENEIIKKKHFLFQRHIKQLEHNIEASENEREPLVEKCQTYEEKIKSKSEQKKTLSKSYSEHTKKFESLHVRQDQLTEAFNKANNKDINIQAEMVEVNKQRKKLAEQLKQEAAKIETNEKIPTKNLATIEEYEGRAQKLTAEHATLETEKTELLSSLRDETVDLQKEKEELQNNLTGFSKVVDETKSAFKVAESNLNMYTSTEKIQREKLESLQTKFESNRDKIVEQKQQIKDLKQRVPVADKQLRDSIQQLERVKLEEARSMKELKTKRVQIEESRSSMQASRSRGRVLDFLTRQKEEGNLLGLFGRLGDLGAINQKYDVAISTACSDLDNIVVDTVDTAQRAIELLKSHNVGRGTFIALDKQEGLRRHANTQIQTPENVPRLYDLVQVEDERVKTAFYYALRNTLVANDIEQATRIAYGAQRHRVVSLKGDVIETSGTMAGGGKTVFRGRMGQSVTTSNAQTPRKMADMETILQQLESKVTDLHQRQKTLEEEVNTLQPELNRMKIDLERFCMEVQYLQQGQITLADQLKTQERIVKESSVNPAQVKILETKLNKTKMDYEKAMEKSEAIQKKVDAVKKQIEDITSKKMKSVNKKLSEVTETLEKFKIELNKLKLGIKTAERAIKTSQNKMANNELEKTECETKLYAFQVERKEIEKDATILLEHLQKISDELKEGEAEFAEEKEAIDKLTQKLNKLNTEKMELDLKMSEFDDNLKSYKDTKRHTEEKLSQLKYHVIPDEEDQPFQVYSYEQLMETDTKQMEANLKRDEERLKAARPNLTAIENYKKKHSMFLQRVNDLAEITSKRTAMRDFRELLRQKRQSEFRAGFNLISSKLKEMYQLITLGGDAELELVDSYDPFQEGIILNVRPPKKSWKNIINLSGGEKTLSSLALVFALHYYKPSPLYFMDEIDAALDFKNVSIVGNYIKERTKNAQFIIISLRSNMFELADHLIGIYKTYNVTKSVTIAPQKMAALGLASNPQPIDMNPAPPTLNGADLIDENADGTESNNSFSTNTSPTHDTVVNAE